MFDHSAKGYAFEPSSDHKLTNCSLSSEWVPFVVKVKGSKRRRLDPVFHMLFPKTQLVLNPLWPHAYGIPFPFRMSSATILNGTLGLNHHIQDSQHIWRTKSPAISQYLYLVKFCPLLFLYTNLISVESNEEQKKFINMLADLDFFCPLCFEHLLTLVLLNPDIPCLYKQYRSRLVALFVIQYMNLYEQSGLSNLIGWQLEVVWLLNLFSMTRVKSDG